MELEALKAHPHTHLVTISVNERPVVVPGPTATGLQIKQAAIDQGVPIQLSFVLSEEKPNHRTEIVGDSDVVSVTKNSRFLAIPHDDNS